MNALNLEPGNGSCLTYEHIDRPASYFQNWRTLQPMGGPDTPQTSGVPGVPATPITTASSAPPHPEVQGLIVRTVDGTTLAFNVGEERPCKVMTICGDWIDLREAERDAPSEAAYRVFPGDRNETEYRSHQSSQGYDPDTGLPYAGEHWDFDPGDAYPGDRLTHEAEDRRELDPTGQGPEPPVPSSTGPGKGLSDVPGVPATSTASSTTPAQALQAILCTLTGDSINIGLVEQGCYGSSSSPRKCLRYLKASAATNTPHNGQSDPQQLCQVGFSYISSDLNPGDGNLMWHEHTLWRHALSDPVRLRAKELMARLTEVLPDGSSSQNNLALMSVTEGRWAPRLQEALHVLAPLEEARQVLLQFLHHTGRGTLLRGAFLARGLQMGGTIMMFLEHKWCTRPQEKGILPLEDGPQELMDLIDLYLKALHPQD